MRVKLTKIWNSTGVRLPKTLLNECGFGQEAELEVRHKMIILAPIHEPREGWLDEISSQVDSRPILRGGEWQW